MMRACRAFALATLLFALLFPLTAATQQPDVRVRILSLYHLRQVRVLPLDRSVEVRTCTSCKTLQPSTPADISARQSLVAFSRNVSSEVRFSGRVRIEAPGVSLTLASPLTIRAKNGELVLVTSMPVEEYVAAAVQGETSGVMPGQALKALAVSVRTYATRFRPRHATEGFDFCDSTHCQHLRLAIDANVRKAVDDTRGQLLWYRGTPAATFHHQDCGGRREAARDVWPDLAAPYLDARSDTYCIRQKREWNSTIDRRDLNRALAAAAINVPVNWDRMLIVSRTPTGRANLLRFNTRSARGLEVSASSLRFAVGRTLGWNVVKSDLYEVVTSGSRVIFTGRGTGHGVGLCQVGAIEMARDGKSYQDILDFYFPGTKLGLSAQGIDWKRLTGSRLDVLTTDDPANAAKIVATAEPILRDAETRLGAALPFRPAIEVFPTVAMFRDATGEPGWVAASTRGHTIRMQPVEVLQRRGEFERSLRHEMLHLLVESRAKAGTPLWFREGLVLYLSDDPFPLPARKFTAIELEAALSERTDARLVHLAYAAAKARTAALVRQHGKSEVFRWLSSGVPVNIDDGN